jgi:hypothetical protein
MINSRTKFALALALAGMLGAGVAMADKPSWAGHKGEGDERADKRDQPGGERGQPGGERGDAGARASRDSGRAEHFEDRHRAIVRDYYSEDFRAGRCPPGLAKKHNGCMPPGQARKWQIGQPLARDVVYYEVPRPLVAQFGQPPAGYRYVRVASDILLLSVGTGMVVDAIRDLGRS